MQTTVQDWPGRVARWAVGIPPSGPMDDLSHRMANALLGNPEDAAALEVTLAGPSLKFHHAASVAVCGAEAAVTLDGAPAPLWAPFAVAAGQTLAVGATAGGARTYVAVSGGLDVPLYLGSRATFPGGALGGHQGRALRAGDLVPLMPAAPAPAPGAAVPPAWRPAFGAPAPAAAPSGAWACSPAPRPTPTTSPPPTLQRSSPPPTASTTTPTGWASAWRAPSPSLRAPTAARAGATPPTCTTTSTPSAPSTSPATCPSRSWWTAPRSAALPAPRPS